ncbi:uncharacterized protein HGUI_02041 [Hanseniaspora guilliermondii]|uniref:Uncharacterized protein n=1 Tax=Hanseniaspora guilliermondii TaxID=56406 RepID=A0A1L0CN48_9ASCO|nr:uncharacterized protein HGUI_02041 [Hanseniaspora guilliermondii]
MIKNLPLFFGVEIILGFLIINKFNSIYGLLSLVTGHKLSTFQLFYYTTQFIVLISYLNGLKLVHRPDVKFYSLLNIINIIDTAILFFSMTIFNFNYNLGERFIDPGNSSQAASKTYELCVLFGMLLVNIFIKLYSNFIILSFTREMMYNDKFTVDNHEEMINLSNLQNFNGGNIFLNLYKTKIEYNYELIKWKSYTLLKDCFY